MSASAPQRKPIEQATDVNGKAARIDRTPDFLQALGIAAGAWQFITRPQLQGLNREGQPAHVRVWAVGMLHSIGYGRECAVKEILPKELRKNQEVIGRRWIKDDTGKQLYEVVQVPLSLKDMGDRAHPKMATPNVSRAINELEAFGLAKQEGATKDQVKVTFYAKPHPPNTNAMVIRSDNQDRASDQSQETRTTIAFSARLRKLFFPRLPNRALPLPKNLVIKPEYQKRVEAELAEVYETVLIPEIQKRLERLNSVFGADNQMVIGAEYTYKEESSSESSIRKSSSSSAFSGRPQQKADEEDDSFKTFENLYPKAHLDTAKATAAFKALPKHERGRAIARLRDVYLGCARWQSDGGRWIPLASNFLKNGSYNEDPPPAIQRNGGRQAPIEDVVRLMRKQRGETP